MFQYFESYIGLLNHLIKSRPPCVYGFAVNDILSIDIFPSGFRTLFIIMSHFPQFYDYAKDQQHQDQNQSDISKNLYGNP